MTPAQFGFRYGLQVLGGDVMSFEGGVAAYHDLLFRFVARLEAVFGTWIDESQLDDAKNEAEAFAVKGLSEDAESFRCMMVRRSRKLAGEDVFSRPTLAALGVMQGKSMLLRTSAQAVVWAYPLITGTFIGAQGMSVMVKGDTRDAAAYILEHLTPFRVVDQTNFRISAD